MVALLVATTAGCATTVDPIEPPPSPAAPSDEPVPGLRAEAVLLRTDEAVGGRFQVRVTNTGDEFFTVTRLAGLLPAAGDDAVG